MEPLQFSRTLSIIIFFFSVQIFKILCFDFLFQKCGKLGCNYLSTESFLNDVDKQPEKQGFQKDVSHCSRKYRKTARGYKALKSTFLRSAFTLQLQQNPGTPESKSQSPKECQIEAAHQSSDLLLKKIASGVS